MIRHLIQKFLLPLYGTTRKSCAGYALLVVLMCSVLFGCDGESSLQTASFWHPTMADCWSCAVYGSVFQVLDDILTSSLSVSCSGALFLLSVFLLMFIVIKLGTVALDPEKTYSKVMKEISYAILKAIAVSIVLLDTTNARFYELFVEYFLQPVASVFLGIANILLDSGPLTTTGVELRAFSDSVSTDTIWNGSEYATVDSLNMFGSLPYQLQLLVFRVYRALRAGVGIGFYIMDHSTNFDVLAFIASIFIIFYAVELSLVVPYTFIESLLRLGIAALILPFLLVCWVCEGSSKLVPQLKSVLPMVIGAFLDIVFTCAFVVVMATTLQIYSDAALDQVWSRGGSGRAVNAVTAARYLHINLLVLVVLMLAFTKFAEKVPELSKVFGGGTASMAWLMRDKVKTSLQGLGKTALGLLSANWILAWHGAKQSLRGVVKK